jgi:hypothetical protein
LWASYEDHFQAWKARADGHEAALLLTADDLIYLEDPSRLYGLPLPTLLLEMGFSVRFVLVASNEEAPSARQRMRDVLMASVEEGFAQNRVTLDDCLPLEVPDKLAGLPSSLVFTEYPPDTRILAAKKMSFHPRDFQMGCAGALATIVRLVRLAENRFFRTFPSPSNAGGVSP